MIMDFLITAAHAQNAPATATPPGALSPMIMLALFFVVFWFIAIRPQMKKAKEHQKMVTELAKGDEVVTQGGVVGRISKISENYVTVEVAEGKNGPVELTVQKQAIGALLPKGTLKSL